MKLEELRARIKVHDKDHPEYRQCIYSGCIHKIDPTWDNKVLCEEHDLMFRFWFYEEDGAKYCPDIWEFETGKKLPKPEGSDPDMKAYRKRYCDWIASLSPEKYLSILKHQIGDEKPCKS